MSSDPRPASTRSFPRCGPRQLTLCAALPLSLDCGQFRRRMLRSFHLAPHPRRSTHKAAEGPVECGLRFVSYTRRDLCEGEAALAKESLCQVHSPSGEILHRRLSDELDETLC